MANDIAVFPTLGAAYNTVGGARLSLQMRNDPAPEPVELPETDPVVDELVGFAKAIRGEGPVEPGGEAGLAVVAVLEAAVESAQSGQAVEVEQVSA